MRKCSYCGRSIARLSRTKYHKKCREIADSMEAALTGFIPPEEACKATSTPSGRTSSALPNLMNIPRKRWDEMSRAEQKNANFARSYGISGRELSSLIGSQVTPILSPSGSTSVLPGVVTLPTKSAISFDYAVLEKRFQELASQSGISPSSRSSSASPKEDPSTTESSATSSDEPSTSSRTTGS